MLRMLNVVNPGNCSGPRMSSGYIHRYYEYIVLAECCVVTQVRGSWKKTSSTPCKNSRSCDKRQCIHLCLLNSLSLSPKITMHPAYRCARLRPSDAVVKNKNFSKKNSEDLFTICINLYNIYILLKGPKFFKDYNCWFNTSPFLQFCEGEATFATTVAPQWWDSRMPGHSLGNTKNMKKNQMLRMKPRGFDDFMRKTIGINGIRRKSSKCIAYMLDWFLCAILRLLTARHLKCRA